MTVSHPAGPRTAVLCGPYLSGKTTLLEAMLFEAGALRRRGKVDDGSSLGDGAPEARAHTMSTELNVASTTYLGEAWTFIDCPGSVELAQEALGALTVADIAVVVCEPDPDKAPAVAPLLRQLDAQDIPHMLFINKMDQGAASVRATMAALQAASARPLVLREIPIRDGETVTGHVDLVSEKAFRWEPDTPSSLIALPDSASDRESEARTELLESLADFDDALLEKLLEDVSPSTGEVYETLAKDLAGNLLVPVFFGSAANAHGVRRLLKALRHDTPECSVLAARQGLEAADAASDAARVRIFKTLHAGHAGKLSIGRLLRGRVGEGDTIAGMRPAGMNRLFGATHERVSEAECGSVVAFGKLDAVTTGDLVSPDTVLGRPGWPDASPPLFAQAIQAESRSDDVKLPGNLQKVIEEDPSLVTFHDDTTGEFILGGQGQMHLTLALEKLQNRSGLTVRAAMPRVAYRETIRKPVKRHARHKKQTGGHGEFGDVHIELKPRARGSGFTFEQKIHGGAVPRQYIPAVEAGAQDALACGPLGFPVVDVSVTLTDGQHHSVDSSEMAFRKAGSQAIRDALPEAGPVLLEPINAVTLSVPTVHTPRLQRIIAARRGQILGFDAKAGWEGWDEVQCQIPAAEMQDLIVELRSATQGAGTFESHFDHLQELTGKDADRVVAMQAEAAE